MGFSLGGVGGGGFTSGMGLLDPMDVTGAGARSSADAQKQAAAQASQATIYATGVAARAIRDANAANIAAQKEATAAAVKAAEEANQKAIEAVQEANRLSEEAIRAGVDTSNQEFSAAYETIRTSLTPWIDQGKQALSRINSLMFGTPEERQNAFSMDPGYQERMAAQEQAIKRQGGALGNLFSGNTGIALMQKSGELASSEFDKAYNRLLGLSQSGRSATDTLNSLNWDMAGRRSAGDFAIANTRSQNAMNLANTTGQGAWNVANAQGGGAQNNANVAITGQNNLANVTGQGAYNVANAMSNAAYANAGADIYLNNQRKENASTFINTAASLYGAYGGRTTKKPSPDPEPTTLPRPVSDNGIGSGTPNYGGGGFA